MTQTVELQEEFIPLKSRVWVSLADAACAILNSLVTAGALTYYFTELRGLSLEWAGTVWLLFGIWNAVNDPLFGYFSDRTESKLGRRVPYIRYGAPIFALSFIAFWVHFPGTAGQQFALFIQMLLCLFVFDTLYTAIATSIYIMPYEMAVSNKARSGIYIWKIIFMVFTIVVPLGIERTIKPDVGEDTLLFRLVMMGIGVGLGAIIYFSTFFYKEKLAPQAEEQFGFITSLKECFANRSFIIFELISFTIIYTQTALMQGIWLYFDEFDVPALPLYIALGLGIILGVFLWLNRRDPWGIKTCVRVMSLLFAIGCFVVLLFGRHVVAATLGFFLFGIGFAGGMYLIPLMNGDVVDVDEERTNLRREGMYAGVNSFITKPAISLAQAVLLNIMAAYGYNQSLAKGMQSYNAETGILMGWVLVPGILLFLCFLLLHWYPLAGPEWDAIKEKLSLIHQEKERRLLEELGLKYGD